MPSSVEQIEHTGVISSLAFLPDGRTLITTSVDHSIRLWDFETREPIDTLHGHLNILAQAHRDDTVIIWNSDTERSSILHVSNRPIDLLAVSPDGRHLITEGRDEMPHWWDLRTGADSLWDTEAYFVAFSPDGQSVVTFQRNGPARIWAVERRMVIGTLESIEAGYQGPDLAVAISLDGKHIAIPLKDNSVGLWNTETGGLVGDCEGHKQPVLALAFSPDSRTLATASADSTVRLWNVTTRTELLADRQLGGQVTALVFSPDGHLLVGGEGPRSQNTGLRIYHAPYRCIAVRDDIQ